MILLCYIKSDDFKNKVLLLYQRGLLFSLLPGVLSGVPTSYQETSVRFRGLSCPLILKQRLAANNSAEGIDPNAINNNHPQIVSEGNKVTSSDATTVFTSDGDVAAVNTTLKRSVPSKLHSSSSTNFHQDLTTFLAKPTVLYSGVLSSTDIISTSLVTKILPQDAITVSAIYKDKLKGFLGFRGDMHIRWQVNATRFQQGRYMLTYVPTGGSSAAGSNPSSRQSYLSHVNTLTTRTQLFRLELDLTCDTEGTMVIPYLSCMNYMPLSSLNGSNYGALGVLDLFPYAPLVAVAGSSNVSYTIWIHFENVELMGPCVPQAGSGGFKNSKKSRKTASEGEQESQGLGPVSSMLVKVSKATALLGPVPLLGDYAKTISWFADIGASAASVFGWSAPTNLSAPNKMIRSTLNNYGVFDAADESLPISASCRNQVGMLEGFSGTDVDELDFAFLKTIPAWNRSFTYTTSNVTGADLLTIQVRPHEYVTRTQNSRTIYDFPPVAFIANHFEYWRGSMVYTFKFVKTEFHSGRLAVAFFPRDAFDATTSSISYDLSNYVHREVIDLRMSNEVTFTIPFISSSSWRPVKGSNNYIGDLVVYVVDPLVAPDTVSSTITVLMEMSGGPDMDFAVPSSVNITPIYGCTPQSGSSSFSNPKPQSNVCALTESTIGSAAPQGDAHINSLYCIGESVSSFRTLLKIQNILAPNTDFGVSQLFGICLPFSYPVIFLDGVSTSLPSHASDLYGRLSSIFLFSRGGVRMKYITNVPASSAVAGTSYLEVIPSGQSYSGTSFYYTNVVDSTGVNLYSSRASGPMAFHHIHQNLAPEMQVPQYHKWHSRVNSEHMINASIPYGQAGLKSSLATPLILNYKFPATGGVAVPTRSGSEDCNFGTFISVPPMAVFTTSVVPL